MKIVYILVILLAVACEKEEPIRQREPEIILRPKGDVNWYAGGVCVNFATSKKIKVDFINVFNEVMIFSFLSGGELVGTLDIGVELDKRKRIEKKGRINGMEFDFYQEGGGKYYIFHTGFHSNTFGGNGFFELYVKKGHESEMKATLSSIMRGSRNITSPEYESGGKKTIHPLPNHIKSIVSKCNLRWDLGREYREGFDWVASLRTIWYDLGADWIPLEGEKGYPNVPERFKR